MNDALAGQGTILLLSGEAGIGKTRLAQAVLEAAVGVTFVRGAATPSGSAFGAITAALRGYLRSDPQGLMRCGPLRAHLALLLPELGDAPVDGDRATLFEAIRCGLATMVSRRPGAMLLDDLQWSD